MNLTCTDFLSQDVMIDYSALALKLAFRKLVRILWIYIVEG